MFALDEDQTETRELARGEALFRQGDPAAAIFRVERGRLRLERRTRDGRLVVIHTALAGEFFAEASLFADAYHCDAVAAEPSRVRALPKAAVLEALAADPAGALSFLSLIARQLHSVRQRLELRNVRSAKERLLLFLSLEADDGGGVPVAGQIQDIAAEIGLSREALYRALAALEKEGVIARELGGIRLKKRPDI